MRRKRGDANTPAYTLGTLFGLAKGIGLSPDGAKEMAYSLIGKDSLKTFTQQEINEVCYELIVRKEGKKHRPGRITDQQLFRVREYERLLGWDSNPLRLAKFVEKVYQSASVLWLTPAQAAKLIESLKAIYEREAKKEGEAHGHCGLDERTDARTACGTLPKDR